MSSLAHWHNLKCLSGVYLLGSNLSHILNIPNRQQVMERNAILSTPRQPLLSWDYRKAASPTYHFTLEKGIASFVHAPNETDKHIFMYAEALLKIRRCKHCIGILSVPQDPTTIHRDPTVLRTVRSRNRIGMLEHPLA